MYMYICSCMYVCITDTLVSVPGAVADTNKHVYVSLTRDFLLTHYLFKASRTFPPTTDGS